MLAVEGLSVAYRVGDGELFAVRDLSFEIASNEILAVVGESGSGKTTAALATLNYLPRGGRIAAGDVKLGGESVLQLSSAARRRIYGKRVAHVAQDPSASLNPALKVSTQLTEGMMAQLGLKRAEAMERAGKLLREVHLSEPQKVLSSYPHQLSGGMQQRVCIAMALACDPELIVMDEPTTGLDAATEAAIFEVLKELRARRGLSVLFISHNLAAVRSLADRVLVMYAGRCVEIGPTAQVFEAPAHRYTSMLIRSLPTMRSMDGMPVEIPWQGTQGTSGGCVFRDRCDFAVAACDGPTPLAVLDAQRSSACVLAPMLMARAKSAPLRSGLREGLQAARDSQPDKAPVLEIEQLEHAYRKSIWARGTVRKTLDRVSLSVSRGEVLALIGESGSGKSTFARCIVGLERALAGAMRFEGHDIARPGRRPLDVSRKLQIVFQNIAGSLHPGKLVRDILGRPYRLYERRSPTRDELVGLVQSVGLKPEFLDKRSPALSGGERQRVALARATSTAPALVVLDEAFSALDVSMKVKVMRLLQDKRAAADMGMLLITHDLPIVRFMADRVAVLYRGWLCETGPRTIIEAPPMHPYTETLMWSALELEGLRPRLLDLRGIFSPERASADASGPGCPFRTRCPRYLGEPCDREVPAIRDAGKGHGIACHIPVEQLGQLQSAEWAASAQPDNVPKESLHAF